MANIAAVQILKRRNDVKVYEWTPGTENDTYDSVEVPQRADKTIQVSGDFGGGNVGVEGCLSQDADIWSVLHDPQGNDIALTAAGVETILENVVAIRPKVPTGAAVSVTIRILMS